MSELSTRGEARARFVQQLPLLLALVVLWMLLWGAVSWLNLVTGALIAVVVTRAFYLPPVELTGRFHPVWFAVFLGRFSSELVVASFQVAAQAFYPRPVTLNAIIAVQLRTRSDFILTLTAISLTLIPGSLAVEVDREKSILYLHLLNIRNTAGVEGMRHKVLAVEHRLARAFGSTEDRRRAN